MRKVETKIPDESACISDDSERNRKEKSSKNGMVCGWKRILPSRHSSNISCSICTPSSQTWHIGLF